MQLLCGVYLHYHDTCIILAVAFSVPSFISFIPVVSLAVSIISGSNITIVVP